MRNYITPAAKLNEIRMLMKRGQFKDKVFVIVEGKTDIKLFRKLFEQNAVQLESVDGKPNVEYIIKAIIKCDSDRIIGISDADFDHITNQKAIPQLYLTDVHDTEMMIIKELGVDAIISEYARDSYHESLRKNLLNKSISIAYEIGLIKLASNIKKYDLNFKEVDIEPYLSINAFNIQLLHDQYIDHVISESKASVKNIKNQLLEECKSLKEINHCHFMVCSGHDICIIVAKFFQQKELSIDHKIQQAHIESLLRVSYGINDFIKTDLYKKIECWQNENKKLLFPAVHLGNANKPSTKSVNILELSS